MTGTMLSYIEDVLAQIEADQTVQTRNDVFARLRALGLDDFGEVLLSMPNAAYPRLSTLLPAMASVETQNRWTGTNGYALLRQTCSFVRSLAYNYARITGRPLDRAAVLDFGCGYGRIARLLYYFCDEEQVYGVDPWDRSIEECTAAGLGGRFRQSDYMPESLPVDGREFDCAVAFSVFTHLSERALDAGLSALRRVTKTGGVLMLTVRPIELWDLGATAATPEAIPSLKEKHLRDGFAFWPHTTPTPIDGEVHYGDASMSFDWLDAKASHWRRVGIDRSLEDPHQIYVFLVAT